jgi:hypothetical protein
MKWIGCVEMDAGDEALNEVGRQSALEKRNRYMPFLGFSKLGSRASNSDWPEFDRTVVTFEQYQVRKRETALVRPQGPSEGTLEDDRT